MKCRHCQSELNRCFVDLGSAPPSNAYLTEADLRKPEKWYPLRVLVCETCWLVQTEDYTQADELFDADYAYFSSTSTSWLQHAATYTADIINQLSLNKDSFVVEVACNDGYLLKNFVQAGIPCLGIEPTEGTAAAAEKLGIQVRREFFAESLGKRLATEGNQADLIVGNNVYAHVPDVNDFTVGLRAALKPHGVITLEFPHLMQLIQHSQFDTVYHEHFSYFSLYTVKRIFEASGLRIWDVETLPTHGGSLRVYGCHAEDNRTSAPAVDSLLTEETQCGLQSLATYQHFQACADRVKDDLLCFLIEQKRAGKKVAAYGAAAKGNTLLNYAGVKPDLLPYVADKNPVKQGKFLPGSRIPVVDESWIRAQSPDYVVIFPWNIRDEVTEQLAYIREWGGQFATLVPELEII